MIVSRSMPRSMRVVLVACAAFLLSMALVPPVGAQPASGGSQVQTDATDTTVSPAAAPSQQEDDQGSGQEGDQGSGQARIFTTLTIGDKPVKGVELVVSRDGSEVGRAATDAEGYAAVDVPESGQYVVTLDKSTFPRGVSFEAGARTELKPQVLGQNDRPVIFRLGAVDQVAEQGPTSFERLVSLFASGLRFGLVIALAAVGLSLIFGTTGLTNFAHGELLSFGAIATWYLNSHNGGLGLPLLLAAIGGIIASAAFGASFDILVYRPLRRRGMPIISQMVVSIGLALATRYLFSVIFGSNSKQFSQYAAQKPSINLGPVALRPKDLVIAAIALVALIAVGLFLQKARLGTAIRAVSDNPSLSIASGINDNRVILIVWAIAGALGGLAGIMLAATDAVQWNMGQHVLLIMFAAVLLGGLGTTFGAMVGGIFVGVVSDMSTFWLDSDLKIVVALATLVLVLLVKPTGVFGVRVRKA